MLQCCHNNFYASSNSIFWTKNAFLFYYHVSFTCYFSHFVMANEQSVSGGVGISENPQQVLQTFITVKWTWVKYWTEYYMILYIWNLGVHLFLLTLSHLWWSPFLPCNTAKHLYQESEVVRSANYLSLISAYVIHKSPKAEFLWRDIFKWHQFFKGFFTSS